MRKPKDQARAQQAARDDNAGMGFQSPDLDEAPRAENAILPSEQPKPKAKTKSELFQKASPRPGSKAPQKPQEAPTAEEAKPATPVARQAKPKPSKPAKAAEKPKGFQPPEDWEKIEIAGVLIGYLKAEKGPPVIYDAYDPDGNHLFFGVSRENIIKRLKSSAASASR